MQQPPSSGGGLSGGEAHMGGQPVAGGEPMVVRTYPSQCGDGAQTGDEECELGEDGCLATCLRSKFSRLEPSRYQVGLSNPALIADADTTIFSRPFEMGRTEVTIADWNAVVSESLSLGDNGCSQCPVTGISWWAALEFANQWSIKHGFEPCYVLDGCTESVAESFKCRAVDVNTVSGRVLDC